MIVFMIASEYVHICDSICIMFGEHSGVCVTFGVSCRDEFYKAHSRLLDELAMTVTVETEQLHCVSSDIYF